MHFLILSAIFLVLWAITVWSLGYLIHTLSYQNELRKRLIEHLYEEIETLRNPKLSHFESLVKLHKERK